MVVLLVAVLAAACGSATETGDEFVFGVVLVGPFNDHGWSEAHFVGAQYAEEKLGDVRMVYLDKMNAADRPNTTLEQVVDRLLQGRGWTLGVLEGITGGAICQRLTASGAAMFRGGRVLPIPPAGAKKVEKSIDMARRFLLELSVDCVLAVQASPEERCSEAAFVSPEHAETWVIGSFGAGERNQGRTAIVALEQVRRILLGSPPIGS